MYATCHQTHPYLFRIKLIFRGHFHILNKKNMSSSSKCSCGITKPIDLAVCSVCRDIPPNCVRCPNQACPRASWTVSPYATTEEKYHTLCHDCRETDRIANLYNPKEGESIG